MIDGNDDVTDTIVVITGPMGITSNSYNGSVYVKDINSSAVYRIGETTSPLQGIIGSVNSMKIQIQQNAGEVLMINHTFRTLVNRYSKVN